MSTIRIFASHDWGKDGVTHARVASVVASLRKRNLKVWFDETHMKGNILDAMCKGIEEADVVLVFVTCNYMKKVEHGTDTDNVRREFMFASATPAKLIPIRFDDELPRVWSGPLRMVLGTQLYVDMSINEVSDAKIDELVDAIRRANPRTMWKTAVAQTRVVPKVSPNVMNHVIGSGNSRGTEKNPQFLVSNPVQDNPFPIRTRVKRLQIALGDDSNVDAGHLRDVVRRLSETLLGTMNDNTPMVVRVARMERELGLA